MKALLPICLVFIGCCCNNIFLEFLVKECPSSGNLITFSQFLFIAIEGFGSATNYGRKGPTIPFTAYAMMVLMFFLTSVVNNYALNFNISMPLHMIFRAGSLMANLVLGVIILKKRYTFAKYLSVVMITVGIATATIASANQVSGGAHQPVQTEETKAIDFLWWLVGVAMLTFALFLSARMGIYQETVYVKYGKHPMEALFYNHALPLPAFLFLANDFYRHILIFNDSAPMIIPLIGIGIPRLWMFLIGNVLTQYICIRSVFTLTSECASLTVTLVVTLRKFLSILLSIAYFKNPFTFYHWIATALVFSGTLLFTDVFSTIKQSLTSAPAKTTAAKKVE